MYHPLLTDATFYNSLFALDQIIAEQIKGSRCPFCQSPLHHAHFLRKPKGIPKGVHCDYSTRFSFCCGKEGCRKRLTPPSMRFLSRKVYSSVIIFLIFLLKSKTDESKVEELNGLLGTSLSVETVRRWRQFWINEVPHTQTWKRAALNQTLSQNLPGSLLVQFQKNFRQQLEMGLKWLLPLTAGIHLFDVPFHLITLG